MMACTLSHTDGWQHCSACGACWDTNYITHCPCKLECANCHCLLTEHFEPDPTMLAENGIDWEEAYCAGKLNYCGDCGECSGVD